MILIDFAICIWLSCFLVGNHMIYGRLRSTRHNIVIFSSLRQAATRPHEVCDMSFLNQVLSTALHHSRHATAPLADKLSFVLRSRPSATATVPNAEGPGDAPFDYLGLSCLIEWPLNIIITETSLAKYNKIFSFLLQIKFAVWAANDVYFKLRRDGEYLSQSNVIYLERTSLQTKKWLFFNLWFAPKLLSAEPYTTATNRQYGSSLMSFRNKLECCSSRLAILLRARSVDISVLRVSPENVASFRRCQTATKILSIIRHCGCIHNEEFISLAKIIC